MTATISSRKKVNRISLTVSIALGIFGSQSAISSPVPQKKYVISNMEDPLTRPDLIRMADAKFNVRGGTLGIVLLEEDPAEQLKVFNAAQGVIDGFVRESPFWDPNVSNADNQWMTGVVSRYAPFSPFGFFFGDEPFPASITAPAETDEGKWQRYQRAKHDSILARISRFKALNPNAFAATNLLPNGLAFGGDAQYEAYVNSFFDKPFDAVSFDYYVLYDNNPSLVAALPNSNPNFPLRYDTRDLAYPKFYYTNQLFIKKATERGKSFWAYGLSVDSHMWQKHNGSFVDIHYPKPTLQTARYYAGVAMAYGAKGLFWYQYVSSAKINPGMDCSLPRWTQKPDSARDCYTTSAPDGDQENYNTIKFVNEELSNSGSLMMSMKWLGTYHGSSTDPFSGEQNLPTIAGNLGSFLANMQSDAMDNLVIGRFQSDLLGKDVFVFFNKSLTDPTSFSGAYRNLNAKVNIQRFLKRTGRWEDLVTGINRSPLTAIIQSTNFGLTLAPGDYEIVVVNAANSRMIGSTKGAGNQTRAIFNANDITFKIGSENGTSVQAIGKGSSTGYVVGNDGLDFLEGDFNGDGRIDLVHVISSANIARIWYSDANGLPSHTVNAPFSPWSGYAVGSANSYLVGDFNDDGSDDLAHLVSSALNIWRGNGTSGFSVTGGWTPFVGFTFSADRNRYKVADFNADGKSDLFYVADGNNGNQFYRVLSGRADNAVPFDYTDNLYLLKPDWTLWTAYKIPTDTRFLHVITGNQDYMPDLAWWPTGQKSHIWTSLGDFASHYFQVSSIRY